MKQFKAIHFTILLAALLMLVSSFFKWLWVPEMGEGAINLNINTAGLLIKRASIGILGIATSFITRRLMTPGLLSAILVRKYTVLLLAIAGAGLFIVLTGTVTEEFLAHGYRNGIGFLLALVGSLILSATSVFLFVLNRKRDGNRK